MAEPILVRRQLGRQLRQLRDRAGKSEHDVVGAKLASRTKLWRIETGKSTIKVADVRVLCWFYGASPQETQGLVDLAFGGTEYSWWEQHGNFVPQWFRLHVGLERSAAAIRYYESDVAPGLFQTQDYAEAVYRAAQPDADRDAIRQQVQLRMRRQHAVFGRDEPPTITAVLNEAVLLREVGGTDVHAAQLRRLRDLVELDHVELRVLLWRAGAHPAMAGAFSIFDLNSNQDPDVVYLETEIGAWYREKRSELDRYRWIFDQAYNQSIPFEEYSA